MEDTNGLYLAPRQCKAYLARHVSPDLVKLGLTNSDAPFIIEISENPNVSMKELSEIMMVDKALTTRKVTALIKNGFVVNKGEGHKYSLVLTDKGEKAAKEISSSMRGALRDMFKCLTEEEKQTLRELTGKIMNSIRGS